MVISSANRLVMNGKRFQILLHEDLQAEAMLGEGSKNLWSETELFLPIGGAVYIGDGGYRCRKIFQMVHMVDDDLNFGDFLVCQNFQVILCRDLERNNLGNNLLGLKNIIPARNFSNSSHLSRSKF